MWIVFFTKIIPYLAELHTYDFLFVQQATKENEQSIVNASFHVTQWNVAPFGTGLSRLKNQPCVFGGDVLRCSFYLRKGIIKTLIIISLS